MFKSLRSLFAARDDGRSTPAASPCPAPAPTETPVADSDLARTEKQVQSLWDQGKPVEAMRLVKQAREKLPPTPGLAWLYGQTLEKVARYEDAVTAYREEATLNPAHPQARQRAELLATAMTAPQAPQVPLQERSWHTSLPRELLLGIQKAHHNYQYRGVPMLKNPFDFALYPKLLWAQRPRTLFEIGSNCGASALWLGDMLNNFGIDGHIHSFDIVRPQNVAHSRVTFHEANGRALEETLKPEFLQSLPRPWLVIEDADHSYPTSSAVLRFFHPWLQPGEYIVVEDGIISDLSNDPTCSSGPHCALKEFLGRHGNEYEIDAEYCDFYGYNVTWCTNGFLRKRALKS